MEPQFRIRDRVGDNVVRVEVPFKKNRAWRFHVLLDSDAHFDSPHALREKQDRHHRDVMDLGGAVLLGGDLFDAMQGRGDPRASNEGIRGEEAVTEYADALVDSAVARYTKIWPHVVLLGSGNHESKFRKHYGTDLTRRVVNELNREHGHDALACGHAGTCVLLFRNGTTRHSITIHRRHGSGSGGKGRGIIKHLDVLNQMEGVDVLWMEHIHKDACFWYPREYLGQNGEQRIRKVFCVRTGTMLDELGNRNRGWAAEMDFDRSVNGPCLLEFRYENGNINFIGYTIP